jgi:DNA-binding beta-propeller fold protein YncE
MKVLIFLAAIFVAHAADPLSLESKIPLPGVKGRFDHFAVDSKTERLFVAALGNDSVEVIDVRSGKRIQSLGSMSKPAGVCFLPDKNQLGVANGGRGSFDLLDAATFKGLQTLPAMDDSDNVRFDPKRGLVLVGFGDGAIAMIDPDKMKVVAQVKLKSHPESFQLMRDDPRIFVNIPGGDEVAVLDRDKRAIVAEWPLHGFKANFPMALDETGKRVLIGCRSPARLLALDIDSGKLLDSIEISSDTDDLFFDAKRQRVYVSCGQGFVDVISSASREKMKSIAHIPTRGGARTSFFSPELDRLYLAVPQRSEHNAEMWIYRLE